MNTLLPPIPSRADLLSRDLTSRTQGWSAGYAAIGLTLRLLLAIIAVITVGIAQGANIVGGSALISTGDAQQIETWLGQGPLTLTKVFSSVIGDEQTAADFHDAADGLGATITVIELPAQGSYGQKIIGGYNPQSWDSSGTFTFTTPDTERTGFLFNLTTVTLHPQKLSAVDYGFEGQYQAYNGLDQGPSFGGGDIKINVGLHTGFAYQYSYGPSGEGFATSICGGGQGENLVFGRVEVFAVNTTPAAPILSKTGVEDVTGTEATLRVSVSSNLASTDVGFQYTTDPNFESDITTTWPAQTVPGTAVGTLVMKTITDLTPETTYYFRAVAINSVGGATGSMLSFYATDSVIAYRFAANPNSGVGYDGYTFGSEFSVTATCKLTHLGTFDFAQDGLAANTVVGLWSSAGVLLATTTVERQDSLNGNCRFQALSTPVTLAAGDRYFVGALLNSADAVAFSAPNFVADPRISYLSARYVYGGSQLTFPSMVFSAAPAVFGANFLLEAPPAAPVANAGPDQDEVHVGDLVMLDGTASKDKNRPARPISYSWQQVFGPSVAATFANTTTATPTFTAPSVPEAGASLVFRLTVSNGVISDTDTVTVNVVRVNHPPTANPGSNQIVGESTLVTLDASSSSDLDGDPLTIQWSQISGAAVLLDGADSTQPTFRAPSVTAAQGTVELEFQLIVNDGNVSSGPATVKVSVKNTNDAPVADAGASQNVDELEQVTLDGTLSSDPDGDALTYSWTQILGAPAVFIGDPTSARPSFQAPALELGGMMGGTTLTFQVVVSDGKMSDASTVSVRIINVNNVPLADAGADQSAREGIQITLDGANSADTDGDALSFSWLQTGGPAVLLSGALTATPNFTTPHIGSAGAVLTFQLTVDDGYGGTASDETVVNVTYVNHPPTASAGASQTVSEGETVALVGTAIDPDGNVLTISWSQVDGPAVTLSGAGTLTPNFTAPQVTRDGGNVVVRLTVDDGNGAVVSSDIAIRVVNINHSPSAQAPANTSVLEGTLVSLIGQGTDPDSEEQSQLTYTWQQVHGPAVTLSGVGAEVEFTAPLVSTNDNPNGSETLVFRLTVSDPNGAIGTDEVDVVVSATAAQHAPTARAGGNLTANEAASVTLNGSASSDPDGDALTYSWTQTGGPTVALSEANTAYPHLAAPFVDAAGATLIFKLTVNDGKGGTSTDTAMVTVANSNDLPIVTGARPSIATLWPPDHSMHKVSILGVVDLNTNATIRITAVTQDESTNGLGDGDTAVDAIISADRKSVLLRAERSGRGNGRVYRVSFTASDFEGSVPGFVEVTVPKNKKADRAINSGTTFESTR